METLDPQLKRALMDLPGGFNAYKEIAAQRFETLEQKINEACYVDLTNGDGKRVKTSKIIPAIYSDLQEIKQATELLVDFSKLHRIFKKWYVYWIAIVCFTGYELGTPLFMILKDLIK